MVGMSKGPELAAVFEALKAIYREHERAYFVPHDETGKNYLRRA